MEKNYKVIIELNLDNLKMKDLEDRAADFYYHTELEDYDMDRLPIGMNPESGQGMILIYLNRAIDDYIN